MQELLKTFITQELTQCTGFVIDRIKLSITAEEAYEDLVGDPTILEAFRNAVQYMNSRSYHDSATIVIDDGKHPSKSHAATLNFLSTSKYKHYLMPKSPFVLTPQSKLAKALQLPLSVMKQWAELRYVTNFILDKMSLTTQQQAYLLPWIRQLVVDCDWHEEPVSFISRFGGVWNNQTVNRIKRDVAIIMDNTTPTRFPIMAKPAVDACRSGNRLFSQYRLLRTTSEELHFIQPVTLAFDIKVVDPTLETLMTDAYSEWTDEEYGRAYKLAKQLKVK